MISGARIPESWRAALAQVLTSPKTQQLDQFLAAEEATGRQIYPPRDVRLTALELTAPAAVKVVILGQDPYHGPGQAHGLAFSVQDGVKVPPSLKNIYKELHRDLALPIPQHGNLTKWARQGVLLLNAALTVEASQPASHQGRGWEEITDAVIAAVAAQADPCVFLLWGSHAQRKARSVAGLMGGHHLVLNAPHPSPLSAHRGFLGCGHFSRANAFLEAQGRGGVDWTL
jgi:uracil-DNA glycosylase